MKQAQGSLRVGVKGPNRSHHTEYVLSDIIVMASKAARCSPRIAGECFADQAVFPCLTGSGSPDETDVAGYGDTCKMENAADFGCDGCVTVKQFPRYSVRRDGRVAEGARLESVFTAR
jgi:hypothetical protein